MFPPAGMTHPGAEPGCSALSPPGCFSHNLCRAHLWWARAWKILLGGHFEWGSVPTPVAGAQPAGGSRNLRAGVRWDKVADTRTHTLRATAYFVCHLLVFIPPQFTGWSPSAGGDFPSHHHAELILLQFHICEALFPHREEKLCLCIFLLQSFIPCI